MKKSIILFLILSSINHRLSSVDLQKNPDALYEVAYALEEIQINISQNSWYQKPQFWLIPSLQKKLAIQKKELKKIKKQLILLSGSLDNKNYALTEQDERAITQAQELVKKHAVSTFRKYLPTVLKGSALIASVVYLVAQYSKNSTQNVLMREDLIAQKQRFNENLNQLITHAQTVPEFAPLISNHLQNKTAETLSLEKKRVILSDIIFKSQQAIPDITNIIMQDIAPVPHTTDDSYLAFIANRPAIVNIEEFINDIKQRKNIIFPLIQEKRPLVSTTLEAICLHALERDIQLSTLINNSDKAISAIKSIPFTITATYFGYKIGHNILSKCFGIHNKELKNALVELQFYINNVRYTSFNKLSDYERGSIHFALYKVGLHEEKLPNILSYQFQAYVNALKNNELNNEQKLTIIDYIFKLLETASA